MPKNADRLAAPIGNAHYKGGKKLAAFHQFGKTMSIHFALLGRKRKYVKSKMTTKLREKRTSIAAVRAKLGQFDIFQTPLLSGCRLPLRGLTHNLSLSSRKYGLDSDSDFISPRIPDPDPDPWVQKSLDPGSATRLTRIYL
jgi:hypothetical protein